MTITYLGHACFLFETVTGMRVIIDPYEPGAYDNAIKYAPVNEAADVVLVTHEHADHNYVRGVLGNPLVCREDCASAGAGFRGVMVPHDDEDGTRRGYINAFIFTLDGLTLCHLGDIGATLSTAQVKEIGPVDVLMVPVGGTFTVDSEGAWEIVKQLQPKLVLPMHYANLHTDLPLGSLDAFINGHDNVKRVGASELELTCNSLPETLQIAVLEPAR